jgi:YD repeat-containing protein
MTYHALGQLTSSTDGVGHVTAYTYNQQDWLTSTTGIEAAAVRW